MQEDSQAIVNVPCYGYDTDKKNILMYLFEWIFFPFALIFLEKFHEKFHVEIVLLKDIFKNNEYSRFLLINVLRIIF